MKMPMRQCWRESSLSAFIPMLHTFYSSSTSSLHPNSIKECFINFNYIWIFYFHCIPTCAHKALICSFIIIVSRFRFVRASPLEELIQFQIMFSSLKFAYNGFWYLKQHGRSISPLMVNWCFRVDVNQRNWKRKWIKNEVWNPPTIKIW